jgi:Raf kinase inhibitor-like YbhB/YbcL family protein
MTLHLQCSAFKDGAPVPRRHSCEGDDSSPPLSWNGVPGDCRSFALVCEDPDAPGGTWYHWAIFDIPASARELHEDIEREEHVNGMRQALNSFRKIGYGGPCPPPGHGRHRYRFHLFALPVEKLQLPARPSVAAVEAAARQSALAQATLTGTYERR